MMVEIFDTWLARTNDGPVNFTIDCHLSLDASTQDLEYAEYVFTTLIKNQHRWKDMYFLYRGVKFSPQFPGFNLTNMPLLTSLNLNLDFSLHTVIVDLTASSRLRRLAICLNHFDLVAGSRLPHLTYAHLRFSSRERIESNRSVLSYLELSRNAPSLRIVGISTELKAPPSSLPLDEERILLSDLRKLSFTGESGSHLPATLVDAVT